MTMRTGGRHKKPELVLSRIFILVAFFLIPLAHLAGLLWPPDKLYGPNAALSSWMWIALLLLGAGVLVVRGASRSALRLSVTYALFLLLAGVSLLWTLDPGEGLDVFGRLATPYVAYLAAWHAARDELLIRWLRKLSLLWIGWIGTSFLLGWWFALLPLGDLSRLMGITTLSLVPLFVFATLGVRSFRRTLVIGLVVVAIAMAADARMVLLVLFLLLLTAPSLDVGVLRRILVGVVAAGVLAVLVFVPSLQSGWFFFNEGDSVSRALTVGDGSLLGGRSDVWSRLVGGCNETWLAGQGVGSSNRLSREIDSAFPEPHNEYVRIYCDTGLAGSVFFWSFLLMIGMRAVRSIWARNRLEPLAHAAVQLVASFLLISLTDIPLGATVQFMVPAAVVSAWSDSGYAQMLGFVRSRHRRP